MVGANLNPPAERTNGTIGASWLCSWTGVRLKDVLKEVGNKG